MDRAAAVATLLAMGLVAVSSELLRSQPDDPLADVLPDVCMDEPSREHVRMLLNEALDAALKTHVEQVFGVWMKALSDSGQPPRARRGTRLGITAYLHSRSALQQWSPPSC
jgi:hypothetical protein